MGKADAEFRNRIAPLQFWIREIAKARKQPAYGIAGRHRDVAVRANRWRRTLAREELRAMTFKTARVLGKIRNVVKSCVAFAHHVPILRWHFMTGIACELLRHDVRRV